MNCRESLLDAHRKGYRVTDDGRVISPRGKERKLSVKPNEGYPRFRHIKNGSPVMVHRLQAFQKFGYAMFAQGIEVRHLDGNSSNNRAENIAIGTKSDNAMDKPADVRLKAALAATRCWQKHSHSDVVAYLNDGHSYKAAMAKFGIKSKGTLSFIARRSIEAKSRQHASLSHSRAVADLYDDTRHSPIFFASIGSVSWDWLVTHWSQLQALLDPLSWAALWVWIVMVMTLVFKFLK